MISKRFFKTRNEVEVTFELDMPEDASKASIVADFLDWKPEPMKKIAKSGTFKFKTRLPKDEQFQFRYLINEQDWVNDPGADQYVPNEFGEDNCLVSTHQ